MKISRQRSISAIARTIFLGVSCALTFLPHAFAGAPARGFYMSLFYDRDARNGDFAFFAARRPHLPADQGGPEINESQPAGVSILRLDYIFDDPREAGLLGNVIPDKATLVNTLRAYGYDWSHIIAVIIDEPYLKGIDRAALGRDTQLFSYPCKTAGDWREMPIQQQARWLQNAADAVDEVSNGRARLWINFSEPEIQWMMRSGGVCGETLNHEYIDVLSLDKYQVPFDNGTIVHPGIAASNVKPYYEWILRERYSHQVIALVPGTFYIQYPANPNVTAEIQAARLGQFFDYANAVNAANDGCLIDPKRITIQDRGCPVWLVAGWFGGDATPFSPTAGQTWAGILNEGSRPILIEWRSQLGLPDRAKASVTETLLRMRH